jgi:uncharacterized spore protein YtfJ
MKKYTFYFITMCLLFGFSTSAFAQEEPNVVQFTETLIEQIKSILNANRVLGKPLEIEGMKIIPVVSFGFGFGTGSGRSSKKEERGTGGGGGGGLMPTSILVITKDGDIKVIPAKKGILSDALAAVIPIIMEQMKAKDRGMEKQESSEIPAVEQEKDQ